MKIACHILGVEDQGDTLRVKLQGKPAHSAPWRPVSAQEITVPNTVAAARGLHVGRHIVIHIEMK